LSEQLRINAIENHPRFKAFYEQKTNTQIEMAKRIVGAENAERVTAILKMPDGEYRDRQVEELAASLSQTQAARLGGVINTLDEIASDRQSQIATAKADFDRMQAENKAKAETSAKQRKEQAEKLFSDTLSKFADTMPVFKKGEDAEQNKAVEERVSYARNLLFGETKPDVLIQAALNAAALPGVIKGYQAALAENAKLQEQIKAMTAAQPTAPGAGREAGGDGTPTKPKQKGPQMTRDTRADAADWVKQMNEPLPD